MNALTLKNAVQLAGKTGRCFVATSDTSGLPHMTIARRLSLDEKGRIYVSAWFCPGTTANIEKNKRVAIVIWDASADTGFQLLGESEKVEEIAILDGYSPALEKGKPIPQVERRLVVRVDKILDFRQRPHSDEEE